LENKRNSSPIKKFNNNHHFWIILIILSSIAVVIEYAETMLFPAIPDIINNFKINYDTSSWILSGYLITAAVMAPIAGKLSDIYGKKKVLLIIMAIFIVSIAAAGFSMNISFLIASRIIQGAGLSMFIIALSILQTEVPREKYALANGILASLYFSGSSIGLVLGGSIAHYFDWRITFFSLLPFLAILYFVTIKFLKVKEGQEQGEKEEEEEGISSKSNLKSSYNSINDNKDENLDTDEKIKIKKERTIKHFSPLPKKDKIDIKGALTLASTIIFFLFALSYLEIEEKNIITVNSPTSISIFLILLMISAISLVFFIRFEKKSAVPLIDLHLITNKTIFPTVITFLILGFTMFMVYQTIPVLVRAPTPEGLGGNALTASMILLPFTIIFLVLSPFVSKIITKLGNLKPFVIASLFTFLGCVCIYFFHANELQIMTSLGIVAIGLALINTIAMNIVLLLTPKQFGGVVIGIIQVFTFTGMAIGPVISSLYLESFQINFCNEQQQQCSLIPSNEAFNLVFITAALASFAFIIIGLYLKRFLPSNIARPSSVT
jgi:MFS family permease